MFERYSDPARRLIFYAEYEAAQLASAWIEPEHLLLALLKDSTGLLCRILSDQDAEELYTEQKKRLKQIPSVYGQSLALSLPMKHVLAHAGAASEALNRSRTGQLIGPEHLLIGLLKTNYAAAEVLNASGISYDRVLSELGA